MKVFFDSNRPFSIEIDPSNTILEMKQKIERAHRIPASKQNIFFNGMLFLANQDSHTLQQYNIFERSRLYFYCCPHTRFDERINLLLQQIQKSPVPSTAMARSNNGQALHQTKKSPLTPSDFVKPGCPAMARSNYGQVLHQTEKSFVPSFKGFLGTKDFTWIEQEKRDNQSFRSVKTQGNVNVQESSRRNDNSQDLLLRGPSFTSNTFGAFSSGEHLPLSTQGNINYQESSRRNDNMLPGQPSSTSNTFGDFLIGDHLPLSTRLFTKTQSYWPPSTTQEFEMEKPFSLLSNSAEQRINDQDFPARAGSSNQVDQTEVINIPDSPESSSNQVVQTEMINIPESPESSSNQVVQTEMINIQDSRESSSNKGAKSLRIMVVPYSNEKKPVWKFLMEVNANENVEELKIELAKKQQRGQLDLPEGGYYFKHKERVVDEKQSFRSNRIDHGAELHIFPGNVTYDDRTDT